MTELKLSETSKSISEMTNEEFFSRLLNFSPFGALVQGFLIEAIASYCEAVIKEPVEDNPNAIISPVVWQNLAKDVLRQINEKYKEPENAN